MTSSFIFKCICEGILHEDKLCSHWVEGCKAQGYLNGERCDFWGKVYTFTR